jgi:hypothetical protein
MTLMTAYLCVAGEKESAVTKKVEILDRFGLSDDVIAKVCGCKLQSVRNARQKGKRTVKS